MGYQRKIETKGSILVVRYSGVIKARNLPAGNPYEEIAKICCEKELTGALLDCRGLSAKLTIIDEYTLGSKVAECSFPRVRIAALVNEEWLKPFSELVSTNRSGWYRVFADEDQAVDWLSGN